MEKLKGFQRKYLKGIAHGLKPVVFVGQKGITPEVTKAIGEALDQHELIKIKFIEFKEKSLKAEIAGAIERETASEQVGMIGHMAIFYRPQKDPEKRKILLPKRGPS
ncbi:MAG: ribosome assembly RNA-binding protein YhbY [Desulfobacterales bacterium]|nr:ribosome assembly RNA-binding protein YhbY [Desulfobacterales bacterium]